MQITNTTKYFDLFNPCQQKNYRQKDKRYVYIYVCAIDRDWINRNI